MWLTPVASWKSYDVQRNLDVHCAVPSAKICRDNRIILGIILLSVQGDSELLEKRLQSSTQF